MIKAKIKAFDRRVQCTNRKASGLKRTHILNTVDYKLSVLSPTTR